jgi:hypothetical protein
VDQWKRDVEEWARQNTMTKAALYKRRIELLGGDTPQNRIQAVEDVKQIHHAATKKMMREEFGVG